MIIPSCDSDWTRKSMQAPSVELSTCHALASGQWPLPFDSLLSVPCPRTVRRFMRGRKLHLRLEWLAPTQALSPAEAQAKSQQLTSSAPDVRDRTKASVRCLEMGRERERTKGSDVGGGERSRRGEVIQCDLMCGEGIWAIERSPSPQSHRQLRAGVGPWL